MTTCRVSPTFPSASSPRRDRTVPRARASWAGGRPFASPTTHAPSCIKLKNQLPFASLLWLASHPRPKLCVTSNETTRGMGYARGGVHNGGRRLFTPRLHSVPVHKITRAVHSHVALFARRKRLNRYPVVSACFSLYTTPVVVDWLVVNDTMRDRQAK